MHGFTTSLAQENARFGITVNTVSPGYIGTDMVMAVPEEVRNKIVAQLPTGRLGNPDEIAYAVSFFIPDDASWITGARSEEPTSELQSLMRISYAVYCFKKKQT